MKIIHSHTVPEGIKNTRLNEYIMTIFEETSTRMGAKKSIKKGLIRVDGETSNTAHWVKGGQTIELLENKSNPPKPYHLSVSVVMEDEHLIIINKPSGLVSSGNQFKTAVNVVFGITRPSNAPDALDWPRPVHRLDSPTSGLLVFAKSRRAELSLQKQFENRSIEKTYEAIVTGLTEKSGIINSPIEERESITHYQKIRSVHCLSTEYLTHLQLNPKSGRTHQLRIHLASIGHPIAGDKLYGRKGQIIRHKGLFLCATRIVFKHPITNEKTEVGIDVPNKFISYLLREERRWKNHNSD